MGVKEGDIVFKVIEKGTRKGSNWMMYKRRVDNHPKFSKRIKQNFFPSYYKGKTIKAFPESPGILCFQYKEDAKAFIRDAHLKNAKIIKVKGIGEANLRPLLIEGCGIAPYQLRRYYFDNAQYPLRLLYSHLSIVAFPAVEVLE